MLSPTKLVRSTQFCPPLEGSRPPYTRCTVAAQALRRKKASEADMDRLAGQRLQLELQINTLESANLNAETMNAMKKASDVLASIHGNMCVFALNTRISDFDSPSSLPSPLLGTSIRSMQL